ncbi:MAG TPA: DUF1295 domain-containing protein, partial [Myxococcales bacterium]|nr:DUF1295 domain-containing protein [Myxococcales bacterium]
MPMRSGHFRVSTNVSGTCLLRFRAISSSERESYIKGPGSGQRPNPPPKHRRLIRCYGSAAERDPSAIPAGGIAMFAEIFTTAATAVAVYMLVFWFVSIARSNVSIVDIAWGVGFVIVAWVVHLNAEHSNTRSTIQLSFA